MKRKYIILMCILVLLLAGLGGFLFVMRPLHYQQTVTVYSPDEGALEVEFDVALHRFLSSADEMRGKIVINDTEYTSIADWLPRSSREAATDHVWNEFCIPTSYALDAYNYDRLMLNLGPDGFEYYNLVIIHPDSSLSIYYGPAASEAEAQDITNHMMGTAEK